MVERMLASMSSSSVGTKCLPTRRYSSITAGYGNVSESRIDNQFANDSTSTDVHNPHARAVSGGPTVKLHADPSLANPRQGVATDVSCAFRGPGSGARLPGFARGGGRSGAVAGRRDQG